LGATKGTLLVAETLDGRLVYIAKERFCSGLTQFGNYPATHPASALHQHTPALMRVE
jgi:hypothetical protein